MLYAATYQRQRRTWGFNGGGPGSAIYKTNDGGATWTKLTNGLPAGDKGRIGLAIYAADPRVVYATVQARREDQGIYRTVDAGTTWEKVSSLDTRPNYYSQIRIDPQNHDNVYVLGSNRGFYISEDGGTSFIELFSNVHGEDHALWLDPDQPNHMIVGGDGGVSITWDRGRTWDFRRNMPIGQFYEVDVDNSVPFRICGGLQDNGVWCMPSAVRNRNGIADRDAWNIGGGDGFHALFDPTDNDMVLQSSQNGNAAWVNIETIERRGARPGTGDRPAQGAGGSGGPGGGESTVVRYRWNWDTPMIVSRRDPNVWYMGAQVLFKSTDKGSSWAKISPDLTLDVDRDTLKMMGAVVGPDALSRHDGQSNYSSLTTISESPLDGMVIYTGSDDGQVQLTRDGGATWTNLTRTIPGVPDQTYVSAVLASQFVAGRVYVTFDGHYTDDYKPYVFVSEDFGATWRSLASGLPETSVNRIAEHPKNAEVLVLAHERGVHASNDGGATWHPLTTNMPTVAVDDVVFQERDDALVAGTHGRGIWVLDDVGPIEALTADALQADATLLPINVAREMSHVLAAGVVRRRRVLRAQPRLGRAHRLLPEGRHHRPRRDRGDGRRGGDHPHTRRPGREGPEPGLLGSPLRAAGGFDERAHRRWSGWRRWWAWGAARFRTGGVSLRQWGLRPRRPAAGSARPARHVHRARDGPRQGAAHGPASSWRPIRSRRSPRLIARRARRSSWRSTTG